jgi:hypothetical protein
MLRHHEWFVVISAAGFIVVVVTKTTTAVKRADVGQSPEQWAQDLQKKWMVVNVEDKW